MLGSVVLISIEGLDVFSLEFLTLVGVKNCLVIGLFSFETKSVLLSSFLGEFKLIQISSLMLLLEFTVFCDSQSLLSTFDTFYSVYAI